MGVMGSLVCKLGQVLKEEHNMGCRVKERISSLTPELQGAQAMLGKVAGVPWDQLDEQVQLWARDVRETSYDLEDILDAFLVRVQSPDSAEQESLLKPLKKMTNLWKKSMARRSIITDIKDIMSHLQEVTVRRVRFMVEDIVARPATTSTVDPRLAAMYTQENKLVGIDKSSSELMSMLREEDMSNTKMKIVSIFGPGGLGKTLLQRLRGDYDCGAFTSVGRGPDLKKVVQGILLKLDKEKYMRYPSKKNQSKNTCVSILHCCMK
jgi:disease resistance protein RPM1